jgi:flagellar basal body-associated protein FliL
MAEQAAPAAAAPAAPAADKPKGGGMMGPLAAGVVLVVIGAAVGWFVASTLSTVKAEGAVEAEAAHGDEGKKKEGDGHGGIAHLTEVSMPDLISNVRNQAGRRYIKLSCSFWLGGEEAAKVGFAGGGGGHGGGAGGSDVKRIVQMALEEHLRSYDIDELTGPNIALQLKKGFKDRIEKTLRELFPDLKADQELVHRVVLTNLLVQ